MADAEKLKEKLSLYLSTLSESAQRLLLRSLENGEREGKSDAASMLILAALREVLCDDEPIVAFRRYAKEEFFKSCQPFITAIDLVEKEKARISPSSIDKIWAWIERDIATEAQQERLNMPCNGMDQKDIAGRCIKFREEMFGTTNRYVKSKLQDLGGEQKLCNHLGGQTVYEDLLEVLSSSDQVKPLAPFLSKVPAEILSWSSPEGEEAYATICKYVQQFPMKTAWLFSAITERLASPRLRVQLASKLAGSDDAVQISATVYSPAIHQVFADMEACLVAFETSFNDHDDFDTLIKNLSTWRGLAKAVETEMEVHPQCPWGKALADMKFRLSDILKAEIEAAPGLMRKALKAPKSGADEHFDQIAVSDATRAILLFHHTERMKETLALNGPVVRARKDLDQSFEVLSTSIVERTRQASGPNVDVCKALGDAAILFAKELFDEQYAAALQRQLNAAASTPEKKAVEA
ncbi:hypothetical protein SAMN04515647_3084 [Cohaesibacter sp. ES.047]|uniref:hypothetical protein n=1 Tax=Cohaesibacter sp. ES.047 TaxID=1798205 RepID=UPI000BB69EB7|nr:hypothetical protein [Cohaesibacter sp. ES.047]SNY92817.1 hypothetical protein SAMN04515647_3084 [Cohaesibacter sp. ES.047]